MLYRHLQLSRLFEVIDQKEEIKNIEGKKFDQPINKIEVKNLCFSYENREVLKNINFTATPNHSIGIVGLRLVKQLFKILPRFYNPNSGSVDYR